MKEIESNAISQLSVVMIYNRIFHETHKVGKKLLFDYFRQNSMGSACDGFGDWNCRLYCFVWFYLPEKVRLV